MKQYLDLLQRVLDEGTTQSNRTGINTRRIEGAMLEFDLRKGFPAVTTKKLAFKQVVGELIGFLNGYTSAAQFRDVGCTIWDQNANENKQWLENPYRVGTDHLGRIYGAQWRNWSGGLDQLEQAYYKILHHPEDRRNIVTAWNPSELHKMALPPCHIMHQYICDPNTRELSMTMYMRSCDMFLGVPFNIASYALLLCIMGRLTGYIPKKLVMFLADVHIYDNHIDQVKEQLSREPKKLPKIHIDIDPFFCDGLNLFLDSLRPNMFTLIDYEPHAAIKAPMAV